MTEDHFVNSRRGFLFGAAKLIGAGAALALVPAGLVRAAESALWVPAHPDDGREERNGSSVHSSQTALLPADVQGLYVTVTRWETPEEPLVRFSINGQHGGMRWTMPPGESVRFGQRKALTELCVYSQVRQL